MNTIQNTYRVPKKIWGRWGNVARYVFNELYRNMLSNQEYFIHTKQKIHPPIPAAYWKVTCWNAAWTAADVAQEKIGEVRI